MFKEWGLEDY
jgi:Fur family ferric uptake transcriptional regulator